MSNPVSQIKKSILTQNSIDIPLSEGLKQQLFNHNVEPTRHQASRHQQSQSVEHESMQENNMKIEYDLKRASKI